VDLRPDEESLAFGLTVRTLLGEIANTEALRDAWDSADGRVPGLWHRLAELGVAGLLVPDAAGGLGLGATSAIAVFVELGRAAIPEPVAETMVGASLLARAGGEIAQRRLPDVLAGKATIGMGLGPGRLVSGAGWSDVLVRRDAGGLVAVEATDLELVPQLSIDHGVRLATVAGPVGGERLDGVDPDAAFDLIALAAAAQLVGLAEAMLDRSVGYALQREQFGAVIGSFQAIKHQLADSWVANAFAVPVVHRAAWSVATGAATRARDVSHAKLAASGAALAAARTALQVHGAIGYTYEHELHIWMKRAWTLDSLWGDRVWHRARVAAAVLRDDESVPGGGR